MRFEYAGKEYRIGFKHDPSRRWDDHAGHMVGLHKSNGKGPAVLHCFDCQVRLSHVPKVDRARKTTCTIFEMVAEFGSVPVLTGVSRPNALVLVDVVKNPLGMLRASGDPKVYPVGSCLYMTAESARRLEAIGRVTIVTKGDRYEREKGQHQSLDNALKFTTEQTADDDAPWDPIQKSIGPANCIQMNRDFRAAAWAAYNGRKKARPTSRQIAAAIVDSQFAEVAAQ